MGTVLQTRLDELTAEVQRLKGILEALPLNTTSTQTAADDGVDMAWKLNVTFIIFLMQVGFGMLEAGSVRAKNTKSILMKNLMDSCISALAWLLLGNALSVRPPRPAAQLGGVPPSLRAPAVPPSRRPTPTALDATAHASHAPTPAPPPPPSMGAGARSWAGSTRSSIRTR